MSQSFIRPRRVSTIIVTCFRESCSNPLPEHSSIIDGHGTEVYYCSKYCEDLSNEDLLREFEALDNSTPIE